MHLNTRLTLACLSTALLLSACASTGSQAPATETLRITLVGDSTQTEKQGYGPGFCANLSEEVDCVIRAKGGASTKTYRAMGLWDSAQYPKPDWMLIQFGHNDVQGKTHADRQTDLVTEFPANLKRYVTEARAAGIQPILLTPIARRYFQADGKIKDDLAGHVAATIKVAAEMKVPLIDLHEMSQRHFEKLGEVEAHKLGLTKKGPDGSTVPDKTHFNKQGAYVLGRMVAEAMAREVPQLAKRVLPVAAKP